MQRSLSLALMLLAVLFAGCASGPIVLHDNAVPADEVATLVLPEQLEVARVNGVEIEGASGMLTSGDRTLELAPGRYEILAFYRELWALGEQHEILRSDPVLFELEAAAGGRYRMDYQRPENLESARGLAADFHGWIEDLAAGERTPSQASGLRFRGGLASAFAFDDVLVPSGDGGGSQAVAPLSSSATAPAATATTVPEAALESASAPTPEGSWLDLMKSWWHQASEDERRAFLRWLAEPR
ncbi:DUF2057 family protein [Thioalkalivibrio sp. XN8]|uniref:DUF2057 family protein n=1 Tax=Thioalkalivibrio sp. XN8 TaxID=2712863 RepID=UPI0013ED7EF0|nr:DUF2057 family protein [Thioalkalivibrio sp. XN8]NGP54205.1 DUF2057 domain-containing protein [Thioalkalivibrio sp. XN8]